VNKYLKIFSMLFILMTPQTLGFNAQLQKLLGDNFGVRVEKQGSFRGWDHSRVNLVIISGLGIISGAVQL